MRTGTEQNLWISLARSLASSITCLIEDIKKTCGLNIGTMALSYLLTGNSIIYLFLFLIWDHELKAVNLDRSAWNKLVQR